ncbi:MAG TPA: amino acid adenylation domain-containing protein, partial [Blastocatellia bacterium]|nr:amino acid adenylation domain-containing protein [Blastocatellia bacterium]
MLTTSKTPEPEENTGQWSPHSPSAQYADHAAWRRRQLSGEVLQRQAEYWKSTLAGAPDLLELPTDRPRPARQDYAGDIVELELNAELTRDLKALSQRHGVTLYMTLLAGWAALLGRLSGQAEVVIGSPVANRMRSEIEPPIWSFVNMLAMRIDVSGSPTVVELLARVKSQTLEARQHQDIPFEQVVEIAQPPRSLAHSPVFQVAFTWQNVSEGALDPSGLTLNALSTPQVTSPFDLSLHLQEEEERIVGHLVYATALFDRETVERRLVNWRRLLEAMASDEGQYVDRLPLLGEAERRQVLEEWNATDADYPKEKCVHELFEAQAKKRPDAVALTHGEESLSYAELNARANRFARRLRDLGVEPETYVAILLERSIDLVVAQLATLKLGAAYAPIDPTFPRERQVFMAFNCAARVVITTRSATLPEDLSRLRVDIDDLSLSDVAVSNLNIPSNSQMTACVMYTSGSTGNPKGAMVNHRGIERLVLNCGYADFNESDRMAFAANPAFDASTLEVWGALLNGASVVVIDREAFLNPGSFSRALEQYGVTALFLTTAIFNQYAEAIPEALARLRLLLTGGERSDPSSFARMLKQSGPQYLIHCYGPTETATLAITQEVKEVSDDEKTIPLGRPINNTRIYVLDADGQPAPIGVVGELYIGGDGVALGYQNRPDLTAERFLPEPFSGEPGSRIYKTGDLVRWLSDGKSEFIGRNDFQVKIRGFRIELGEIEACLARHPDVREVVALARKNDSDDTRLVAYVTPRPFVSNEEALSAGHERVMEWTAIYEDTYGHQATPAAEIGFNVIGWNSSYTRSPIPVHEMRDWLDSVLARIRALRPNRVLEIGCGSGMILFNIAPQCERYVGTDLSQKAIDQLAEQIGADPALQAGTQLIHSQAEDFSHIPDLDYDTIILNSVVQYFPNIQYLFDVIEKAIGSIRSSGHIFIGDVRNYRLLDAFHLSVQLFQASPGLSLKQLASRVAHKARTEPELLIDPAWFFSLRERFPEITGAQVIPKQTKDQNELSAYRYDVVLSVRMEAADSDVSQDILWIDCKRESRYWREIKDRITGSRHPVLGLRSIANPRVVKAAGALGYLANSVSSGTAGELKTRLNSESEIGVTCADLASFCAEHGYAARFSWFPSDTNGEYHALLTKNGRAAEFDWRQVADLSELRLDLSSYANNPLRARWLGTLPERLRAHLSTLLPGYMLPVAYVTLDEMPLTPNGKLDRRALPAPDSEAYVRRAYEPPRSKTEILLARIWADALGIDQVGRNDNFFELGGHSLLGVSVIERMRREGLPADVRALLTAPTLRSLAGAISGGADAEIEVPPNLIPPGCRTITPEMLPLLKLTQDEIDAIVERVPGGAANIQDIYPLAPLQEGIFFHHLMESQGDTYLVQSLLAFDAFERLDAFIVALRAVIARHDALRTAVVWEGLPEPAQVVWREAPLRVEEISFDPLETASGGGAAGRLLERFDPRRVRLDVRQAPMIRCVVARDAASDRWLLLWQNHHLIVDHVALDLLLDEVKWLLLGQTDRLSEPLPFRNFVAQAKRGVSEAEHEAYFREMLGDVEEPTAPFGLLDVQGDGSGVEEARVALDPTLARRLRERARALGVSAASLCHLAWAQVLARTTGREDVVFGTVLFGRMQSGQGADRALGLFMNTLPVRMRVGEEGVARSARQAHETLAGLMRHEHASLALAQRCSGVAAPMPLFSSLLNYVYSHQETELARRATMTWAGFEVVDFEERTNYPLVLDVEDLGDGFYLAAQSVSPVAPVRICEFMRTALEGLVEALETSPERVMRSIDPLPEAERRRVLEEWNATEADYPVEPAHEVFEAQVELRPEAIALVCEDQTLSYGELNARANRLARRLKELGVGPDARVAICVGRSFEMVIALLATLKAGGAYVPLDPTYPPERLAYMLKDSAPMALLAHDATIPLIVDLCEIPVMNLDRDASQWAGQSAYNLGHFGVGSDARSLAYVIYTSGSTGMPRGVMIEHRGLCNQIAALKKRYELNANDRILQFASIAFDMSVEEIFGALLSGATLTLRTDDWLASANDFYALCRINDVSIINLPPVFWQELVQEEAEAPAALRQIMIGGDAVNTQAVAGWFSREGYRPRLFNAYGPTESTVNATIHEMDADDSSWESIGRPIANTRIYLLDGDRQPAPVGVAGEIYIGGIGVARGYLNCPDLTVERFMPDPFAKEPGARMYKTGDLARYLAGGNIEFLGRNDFQVKIRGFRVELGEIEARLTDHPGVREAAVAPYEDGLGGKRLVAYYTGAFEWGEEVLNAEVLRAHLLTSLPEYMVPPAYVRLETLPLTPNGKVDRRALHALPPPDDEAYVRRGYEPPVGEIETRLARIWAELLHLDRVGRHDNYFELGGHSLLAVRMIERMRREGLSADVRALFTAPTLRDLAEVVSGESVAEVEVPPNLIPPGCRTITPEMLPLINLTQSEVDAIAAGVPGGVGNVQDIYPLAPLQEGVLFHHLMNSHGDVYLDSTLLVFETRERLDAFVEALRTVIARHDILRTAVVWEGLPEPAQVVWREAPLRVEEVSLDPLETATGGGAGRRLRERFDPRRVRLDVRQAPMMRCIATHDAANDRWLLLWLNHHLTVDHLALELLVEEAKWLLLGQVDRLSEPLPFRNFVAQAKRGVSEAEHEAYFREMLGDVEEPTAPFGLLDVRGDGSGVKEARIELDSALARRLRESARALGVSAASLCHLAWAQALARTTGREDVVFGTVLFGRMQGGQGADRALGLFINTLPVRMRVGEEGVERSARQTHKLLAGLMRHEHASLALAQRCSGVAAPKPLFNSLLNYRHISRETTLEFAPMWAGIEEIESEERTNYPLLISVEDFGDDFGLTAQAVMPIEPGRICEFMRTALERLVEALEKAPETEARAIDVLPEAERRQVLAEWNATEADYPREKCVHELFEARVKRTPDAVALVCGDQSLSYRELNSQANRLARRLGGLGVEPGGRVAILLERSIDLVIAEIATLKLGAAYVP